METCESSYFTQYALCWHSYLMQAYILGTPVVLPELKPKNRKICKVEIYIHNVLDLLTICTAVATLKHSKIHLPTVINIHRYYQGLQRIPVYIIRIFGYLNNEYKIICYC